jgi:hypothetical protein
MVEITLLTLWFTFADGEVEARHFELPIQQQFSCAMHAEDAARQWREYDETIVDVDFRCIVAEEGAAAELEALGFE